MVAIECTGSLNQATIERHVKLCHRCDVRQIIDNNGARLILPVWEGDYKAGCGRNDTKTAKWIILSLITCIVCVCSGFKPKYIPRERHTTHYTHHRTPGRTHQEKLYSKYQYFLWPVSGSFPFTGCWQPRHGVMCVGQDFSSSMVL